MTSKRQRRRQRGRAVAVAACDRASAPTSPPASASTPTLPGLTINSTRLKALTGLTLPELCVLFDLPDVAFAAAVQFAAPRRSLRDFLIGHLEALADAQAAETEPAPAPDLVELAVGRDHLPGRPGEASSPQQAAG